MVKFINPHLQAEAKPALRKFFYIIEAKKPLIKDGNLDDLESPTLDKISAAAGVTVEARSINFHYPTRF